MSDDKSLSPQRMELYPLILVVEQDDDTRLMLQYLLELWKYRVAEAATIREAVKLAEQLRPSLILMNIEPEGVQNLTTNRRMRELTAFDGATIVLISTPVEPEVRTSALAVAGDFLIKPIDFGYLEKILEKYLRKANLSPEATV